MPVAAAIAADGRPAEISTGSYSLPNGAEAGMSLTVAVVTPFGQMRFALKQIKISLRQYF
jgi:hypothetical protein